MSLGTSTVIPAAASGAPGPDSSEPLDPMMNVDDNDTAEFERRVAAVAADSKSSASVSILPYSKLAEMLCEAPERAKWLAPVWPVEHPDGYDAVEVTDERMNRMLSANAHLGQNLLPLAIRSRFFEKIVEDAEPREYPEPEPCELFWSTTWFDTPVLPAAAPSKPKVALSAI